MKKIEVIVVVLYILCHQVALGQDLSTISYGIRSEIKTNTIYDIHFSSDSLLYVATDKGLWRYNGIKFTEIPIDNGTSLDGTYIREPFNGQIYIQGFQGQLYQVIDDSLRQQDIPKEIDTKLIGVHLGKKYMYYVTGNQVFVYTYQGEKKSILTYPNSSFDHYFSSDGFFGVTLLIRGESRRVKIAQLTEGRLEIYQDDWSYHFVHQFQNKLLIKNQADKQLYTLDSSLFIDWSTYPDDLSPRLVYKKSNTFLVGCAEGLYLPNKNRLVFKGKYITDIVEDYEGNLWIATLNNGLHKLLSLENYFYPIENEHRAVNLIHKREDKLIYADIGSNLYHYNGNTFDCVFESRKKVNPKSLYFDEVYNVYVLSGSFWQTFSNNLKPVNYQTSYGRFEKDLEGQTLGKFRVGARIYYGELDDFNDLSNHINGKNIPDTLCERAHYKILLYNEKIKIAHFDEEFMSEATYKWANQLIYYFNDTLYLDGLSKPLKRYQVPISGDFKKVLAINGRVYVQTSDSLLEFNLKAAQVNAIPRNNGLERKIEYLSANEKYLCITTLDAVYVLDLLSLKILYKFTAQNGIVSIDFNKAWIFDERLYVNGSGGVTEIALSNQSYYQGNPVIKFKDVLVNGKKTTNNQFSYQQNNLKIELAVRSFIAEGKLYWRLNDNEWRTQEGSNLIQLDGLQYGKYRFEAYWMNDLGVKSSVLNYIFVIHRPYWLQTWFIVTLLGISIGIIYVLYKRRMRQLQLENNLIASQMTALKSQMNPHFIFNALNSIQSLIVYQRIDEAFNYVDKFSVLLRQILNFSDLDFISLNQEIDMLRNYLDMEKMRFDGHLDITIEACEDTDVQIPSMIIQPFVENAIKHGLLHKTEGNKMIQIRFELLNDDTLICEVWDNGIGRKAVQALQSEDKRLGKSFSTNATQKRLELLQKKEQFERLGVEYTDLEDGNGNALGTKVKITIPVE